MSKVLDLWSDMTGVVLDYALSTPPSSGWLMCFGQALLDGDPVTARLRSKLLSDGSPYGTDGTGNPRVPDVRGRVIAGLDDMGGAAAGRLTNSGVGNSGINGGQIGSAGGVDRRAMSVNEMPEHKHAMIGSLVGSNSIAGASEFNIHAGAGSGWSGSFVSNNGSGHNYPNVQPTIVLNKIIRL